MTSQTSDFQGPAVTAWRGPFKENTHAVTAVVARADGSILASCGNPEMPMVLRSTAKPFQALALFHSGAVARFGVKPNELALACASHDATQAHTSAVYAWLTRLGLDESSLDCGPHPPGHSATRDALIRADSPASAIHNNCSGKHTGMLASCLAADWPTNGYLEPDHPLQRSIHQTLERLTGSPVALGGVDGCSAPTFTMPVAHLAKLCTLLAEPSSASQRDAAGLGAAFDAMRRFPELVAGPTTIDTHLMHYFPNIVCKRGAAGGYAIAIRGSKWGNIGVGIWVHDGSDQARGAAVLDVLNQLGLRGGAGFDRYRSSLLERTNCAGRKVGHFSSALTLKWSETFRSV